MSKSDCRACHDPHAAGKKGLLRANQHSPFAGGDCNSCHTGTAFAIQGDVKSLCVKCHQGAKEFAKSAHHHNLDDEASCKNCHNPHASDTGSLLAAKQQVLCMRCHFNEPVRKEKAAYLTHGGMDCTECHLPHGADNPRYFATDEIQLCSRCHEDAHRVSHPVGPEVIDARTEKPVTCVSCHQLHGPDFDKYLPLDPSMDLCIQCHRR
jgi:predicted CXXCH cytochrome family protein